MTNKICVYAICKNEMKFVEKWVESMSEADYIVVLDTGSDDGTYEALKNNEKVYRVEQKVITPWRFDVARNESMKLIPEDANILICTDLDELFDPGWAEEFRKNWKEDTVQAWYKYAWSHNENGDPQRIFYYNKCTDRNWHWECPVHETLTPNDKGLYTDEYISKHLINLFESVYLHHYADRTKSRGSYLPLLEIRVAENPDDYNGKIYLSHEYYYRGFYDKSIELLSSLIDYFKENESNNTLLIGSCYLFMGDDYVAKGCLAKALESYSNAIMIEPTYREPYFSAADVLNTLKLYRTAIGMVEDGVKNSVRHFTWLERDTSWNEQEYDILSISYFYIGEIDKSYMYCLRAHELNPNDTRINNNLKLIKNSLDDKK